MSNLSNDLRIIAPNGVSIYTKAADRLDELEFALRQIVEWDLPPTEHYWDDDKTRPMSYEAAYGSNGARDYIRRLAENALNGDGR